MDFTTRIKSGDNGWVEDAYKRYRDQFINRITNEFQFEKKAAIELFKSSLLTLCESIKSGRLAPPDNLIQAALFEIGEKKGAEYRQLKNNEQPVSIYDFSILYEEEGDHKEKQNLLTSMLDVVGRLGPPCLPLLHLVYYENKSWEEINGLLGYKTVTSSKSAKHKCVQKVIELVDAKAEV